MSLEIPKGVLEKNLGFLISDVHRLITTAIDKEMKALDLTRSQLRVLLYLLRTDGITQIAIADGLQLGKVTVGGLLDRLEEKGLVERREHPTDRRSKRVFLTSKKEKFHGPVIKTGAAITNQLLDGLSVSEQELLIDLLLRVKQNSQKIIDNGKS